MNKLDDERTKGQSRAFIISGMKSNVKVCQQNIFYINPHIRSLDIHTTVYCKKPEKRLCRIPGIILLYKCLVWIRWDFSYKLFVMNNFLIINTIQFVGNNRYHKRRNVCHMNASLSYSCMHVCPSIYVTGIIYRFLVLLVSYNSHQLSVA